MVIFRGEHRAKAGLRKPRVMQQVLYEFDT